MSKNKNNKGNKILWAFIWIAVGILWMLSNYGKLPFSFAWQRDWPIVFIIIGLAMLLKLITYKVGYKKKKCCTVDIGNVEDAEEAKIVGGKAKWLKIRVYKTGDEKPEVKVTMPISVIKAAVKLGGKFNMSIPDSAREKMEEKGINLDAETFENIDELFDELAVNGRFDIINVVDEENGERVEIYVE